MDLKLKLGEMDVQPEEIAHSETCRENSERISAVALMLASTTF